MAFRLATFVFLVTFSIAVSSLVQGCEARPAVDLPEPPTLNNAGRELKQDDNPPGPAQAGWLEQQVAPSVTCTTGTANTVTAEALLQACQDGSIGASNTACGYLQGCTDTAVNVKSCTYYENIGDYSNSMPCSTNNFNGQTITVYDESNLKPNNDEVVWADASVPSNEPTGVQACNVPQGASYTLTATYSKSSSWNIGIQLGAKIMSDYEAKLTAGYSQTYSKGTNAGVTVSVEDGQHGTVTAGTLVHHALGWWDVQLVAPYDGCTEYRVDNVAADLIAPSSDPNYVSDFGVEVKPCGYPLLSGALN
ncbi:TPA: hypothetical protein ACH3X2_007409 [Trebouxia sp. C0005]